MSTCTNCFTPADMRSAAKCDTCEKPLHSECAIKDGGTFCDVCYTLKEEKPAKPTHEIPDVIRRSYIEQYKKCPKSFKMQVLEGDEAPPTCYTQLGIDLHDMFDKAANDRAYTKPAMLADFEKVWGGYEDGLFDNDESLKEKMYSRGIDSIDTFFEILSGLPIRPFATEEKIIFSIGENIPKVSITMDRIDDIDGELEMLDWKTGHVMVGQKLSSDLQAPLYIYAVTKHFKRDVRKFTFYYLEDNKIRIFERSDNPDVYICRVGKREYKVSLMDAIREVQSIFNRIKKGDFNVPRETRKMYFTCKMCHLQKEGKCAGAEQESWGQHNNNNSWGF